MNRVKIGIYDEEKQYVERLAAYINRKGKEQQMVVAFTEKTKVEEYLARKTLDIIISSEREALQHWRKKKMEIIWLNDGEDTGQLGTISEGYTISKYSGANEIAKVIEEVEAGIFAVRQQEKPMVAIYSPVGRCGKTSFALEFVKNVKYGKWLYIGMEDYHFFSKEEDTDKAELFLYYLKERQGEKLQQIAKESQGVIPSVFSPFDTKQIEENDICWLMQQLRERSSYAGAVFDLGTGILQKPEWLEGFDLIIVPYVEDEKALKKKAQWEKFVQVQELDGILEKMVMLNMGNRKEVLQIMDEIGYRGKHGG